MRKASENDEIQFITRQKIVGQANGEPLVELKQMTNSERKTWTMIRTKKLHEDSYDFEEANDCPEIIPGRY